MNRNGYGFLPSDNLYFTGKDKVLRSINIILFFLVVFIFLLIFLDLCQMTGIFGGKIRVKKGLSSHDMGGQDQSRPTQSQGRGCGKKAGAVLSTVKSRQLGPFSALFLTLLLEVVLLHFEALLGVGGVHSVLFSAQDN